MKLEISCRKEDLKKVDDALEPFIKDFEIGYKESIEKAINNPKAKMIGLAGRIENFMPNEIMCIHKIEGDKVILLNSLPDSKIAKMTGQYRKLEKGVHGYLEYMGFKNIKVKMVKHKV